jgi:hypothetical protein
MQLLGADGIPIPRPEVAVPTVEEVTAAGYSAPVAQGIVAEQKALASGMDPEHAEVIKRDVIREAETQVVAPSPAAPMMSAPPPPPSSVSSSVPPSATPMPTGTLPSVLIPSTGAVAAETPATWHEPQNEDEEWPDPVIDMPTEFLCKMADAYQLTVPHNISKAKLVQKIHKAMYED